MKRYVHFPKVEGQASRQAHADLPRGHLRARDQQGRLLRPGRASLSPPPAHRLGRLRGAAAPARLRLHEARRGRRTRPGARRSCCTSVGARALLALAGKHAARSRAMPTATSCCSCTQGRGDLFCDYGHLAFEAGDYVADPARHDVARRVRASRCARCSIEATNNSYRLPDKGLVGPARDLRRRRCSTRRASTRRSRPSRTRPSGASRSSGAAPSRPSPIPFNPLDAVGWHGDLSRGAHQRARPPPADEPSLSPAAVGAHHLRRATASWCARFVPRPFETDPGAIKVPFFHNNDDYDEVIFYHAGDFFSRDNIHPGMITLHPGGFTHGPHPEGAEERASRRRSPRPTNTR